MISFRRVNLQDKGEMQTIAAIDMTIPALFDPLFQVNEKTIDERLQQLLKAEADDFFEVALDESEAIIGFHFLNKTKSPHGFMIAQIQTLWVDPSHRNQGIGRKLKARGEEWARLEKLDHISTFVHKDNSAMLKLNENQNFELVGFNMKKQIWPGQ